MEKPKEKAYEPHIMKRYNYCDELKPECLKAVDDGIKPRDAAVGVFGIKIPTWYRWVEKAAENVENGYTAEDNELINFMTEIAKHDLEVKRRLSKKAMDLALDDDEPDTELLKFLLKTRGGFTTTKKSEVEISGNDDKPLKVFNIVRATDKKDKPEE